jgi:hypothetical protein
VGWSSKQGEINFENAKQNLGVAKSRYQFSISHSKTKVISESCDSRRSLCVVHSGLRIENDLAKDGSDKFR